MCNTRMSILAAVAITATISLAACNKTEPEAKVETLQTAKVPSTTDELRELRVNAERGNAEAQTRLARMYAEGRGVTKDEVQAAAWFRKAAEQGYAAAQYNLGLMYEGGLLGATEDEAQAVAWYRKAAEQGYADAQLYLGAMYAEGRGVTKDEVQAAAWFRKAAEQGHAAAQYNLGLMYKGGLLGVTKDEAQAAAWFRKAAEQGLPAAQFFLGMMYANGQGVAKNYAQAVGWFRKAAEQGHVGAQYILGLAYAGGEGVTKSEAQAAAWFRKAAEQGDAEAQYKLGAMYILGSGVTKDEAEGIAWLRKAAEQGHANAQHYLDTIHEQESLSVANETQATGINSVLEFQQRFSLNQQAQRNKEESIKDINDKLNKKLVQLHYDFYNKLKNMGVAFDDPMKEINTFNDGWRKEIGFNPISVREKLDGGFFVITTQDRIDGYKPSFALKGYYNLISLYGHVDDAGFRKTGILSPDCMYDIGFYQPGDRRNKKYRCNDVLSGAADKRIIADMETMLTEFLPPR